MVDLLGSGLNFDLLKNFVSEASQTEFAKTCAIFGFAAYVHARQVRKEIKSQFGELVGVVREDLNAQKSVLAQLGLRVENIETRLINFRGEPK